MSSAKRGARSRAYSIDAEAGNPRQPEPVSLPSLRHEATLAHLPQTDDTRPSRTKSKASRSNPASAEPPACADDEDPLAGLQEVPVVNTRTWEDLVHAIVWRTGRQFGFQAFNVNPQSRNARLQQWVPSTIFLASDHLVALLVKNMYTREKAAQSLDERFAKAVWSLHGAIFASFEDKWCSRMQLPVRIHKLDELAQRPFSDPQLVHGLLCELALYFLMYTEGANLRLTPEALWFLFWCSNTSPQMEALWDAGPPFVVPHARTRRVAMRNAFQVDIVAMQYQFQHNPTAPGMSIGDNFKAMSFMEGKVSLPSADKVAAVVNSDHPTKKSSGKDLSSADMGLYEDLIALGDGGFWCDTVLTPIFYVLSFEMDAQFAAGQEVAFRLGYDDINECLSNKDIIMTTLKHLNVTSNVARSGAVNGAYDAIIGLGAQADGTFDPQVAATFWASKVFTKTTRERRSWAAVYRAFYRIYCLHLVLIHLFMAHAFSGSDPLMLSGAVVTHAFLHFGERWSAWYMSRDQHNPLNQDKKKKSAKSDVKDPEDDPSSAKQAPTDPLAEAAKARTVANGLEGAPVWGFFGCWEWLMVALGLLVLYVCQFVDAAPPALVTMSKQYWLLAAGGYTAAMIGHALLTTRDGYSISLTHFLRLPSIFKASSARPAADFWIDGNMKIGAKQFWLLVAFWTQTLVCKGVFDYFVIIKPLVQPIKLLLTRNWLGCASDKYNIMGTQLNIACIDGDWVLIFVRVLPLFLVCLMDTHIFYQITLIIWGVIRGIFVLDIGVVGNWDSLVKDFHNGPVRWWDKVMSQRGNQARQSLVALKRAQAELSGSPDMDLGGSSDGVSSGSEAEMGSRSDLGSMVRARLNRKSSISSKSQRSGSGKGKGSSKQPSDMALILTGQTDEHIATWDAFAAAWDEIVADLREADLISNREMENLRFTRLCYDRGLEVSGTRPILLPAFFFAGQIQKVVDTGLVSEQQSLVLSEARSLLVWLGSHLGLLAPQTVTALLEVSFMPEVVDLTHQASRQCMMAAAIRMLGAMQDIHTMRTDSPQDLRRRQALHAQVAMSLGEILSALEMECQAVRLVAGGSDSKGGAGSLRNKFKLGSKEVLQAEGLLAILMGMRSQLAADASPVSAALRVLHDQQDGAAGSKSTSWGESNSSTSSSTSAGSSSSTSSMAAGVCDTHMVMKAVGLLAKMLTLTPAAARPESEEPQRILGFFMSSLANKQLSKPVAMDEMMSWTVLTPCYEEDVLYPMDAGMVAQALHGSQANKGSNLQDAMAMSSAKNPSSSAAAWGRGGLSDLLTETEDRVSLMALLRSVFTSDFQNFKERLGDRLGVDISHVSEDAFAPGGPLAELALELQLWASFRGQLLARTVRGMMCYDKALRVLARLENPCPTGMSRRAYDAWISDLVSSKFSYVVSAQVYGRNRSSPNVRQRWLAEGIDVLLEVFEPLKVAFLDTANTRDGMQQYSVLIQGRNGAPAAWEAADFVSSQRVNEMYRVRLPQNRYSSRGVIIGEGKPENQNHAMIFCLGEGLQTIDMNQDNNLAEAYKMRNMLGELAPEIRDVKGYEAPLRLGPSPSGAALRRAQATSRSATRPTALVGFCENIFSDKSGALGSFAASAEFAFGTIVQRTMDTPGNVRMHYGHPDVFNKVYGMTRGGVSKATRQLHISEDIFGGYNHTLRGARIRYREYMSVGKGRDMGFDSINAFEIKISGGAGEVLISRDLWRLSTRMDFFRLLHFYFSGCGYYVNTWIICMTVAAQVFSLCFLAMARAGEIPVAGIAPADPLRPNDPPKEVINLQDTLRAEYVLQLGTLSLLPYVCELALEHGLFKMLVVAIQQILAGSFAFFVFKQQTTAHFFHDDMAYGGACYIGTGRGFSITSSQFLKLWTNYSRSHIYPGVELMSMCFLLLAINDCHYCDYGSMTWGVWLVSASLIFAPFWFNPMVFSTTKVKRDFFTWTAWLNGEVDPETGTSWHQWHRKMMSKIRNDQKNQPTHWANAAFNIVSSSAPLLLLTLAAVSRLTVSVDVAPPGPLRSSYVLFLVATAIIWTVLSFTLSAYRRFNTSTGPHRSWRLHLFWTATVCTAFVVAYLTVLGRWYSGNGFSNLLLILYSNVNLVFVAHRVASQLATKSPAARALVDAGYLFMDSLIGYTLLAVIGLLSFTGVVGWLQSLLLFNPTFAKSIRRGQLVTTIGLARTDPASQQPQIAMIENAVSSVSAASPAPTAVPRSRSASVVAARMQVMAAQVHVDDSVC